MNFITLLIVLVIVLLIKWSLAPCKKRSKAFILYKLAVIVIAWLGAALALLGVLPAFAGASTLWLMVFIAILFSLPTFLMVKKI